MNAIQQIVTVGEGGQVALCIAKPAGSQVRVWVLEVDDTLPEEALALARLQEATGFARTVLTDPAEDVWNDL